MATPDIIIAIDGYSSTGKSSFAKLVAAELGFLYLDSGALYRSVTLFALEQGLIDKDGKIDEEGLKARLPELEVHFESQNGANVTCIGDRVVEKEIRTIRVSGHVSPISALSFVREFVDDRLHSFGRAKRVVMDGRDIGTTVFPDAELKIFMTADPMVRARRRAAEMEQKGEKVDIGTVLENLRERDYIDSHREISPLRQAEDAVVLDNSEMTLEEEVEWIKELIRSRFDCRA